MIGVALQKLQPSASATVSTNAYCLLCLHTGALFGDVEEDEGAAGNPGLADLNAGSQVESLFLLAAFFHARCQRMVAAWHVVDCLRTISSVHQIVLRTALLTPTTSPDSKSSLCTDRSLEQSVRGHMSWHAETLVNEVSRCPCFGCRWSMWRS